MSIDPRTELGQVSLRVSDLDRSLAFYERVLGFQILRRVNGQATLGTGRAPLVSLIETLGARPKPRRATGLYHFAILVPSRLELARSLARLVEAGGQQPGASDHGVSEALYLADPDGNGIEIYRDRARHDWPTRNGALDMVIAPLNLTTLVAEAAAAGPVPRTMDSATRIGHVHLHVSDLAEAEAFYCGVLGFDVMQRLADNALFVSAGGYHHHLGLNTWAGVGAPPPPAGSAGLEHFVVTVPDPSALVALRTHLAKRGVMAETRENGWLVRDPSGNAVLLSSA